MVLLDFTGLGLNWVLLGFYQVQSPTTDWLPPVSVGLLWIYSVSLVFLPSFTSQRPSFLRGGLLCGGAISRCVSSRERSTVWRLGPCKANLFFPLRGFYLRFFSGRYFFLLSYFGGHHFVGAPTPRAASAGSRSRVLRPHRRRPEEVERFSLFLFPGCPCFLEGPREASPESNQ